MANSLHALAEVVAGLHLRNGSVSIPGFYECAPCLAPCTLVTDGAMHARLCFIDVHRHACFTPMR